MRCGEEERKYMGLDALSWRDLWPISWRHLARSQGHGQKTDQGWREVGGIHELVGGKLSCMVDNASQGEYVSENSTTKATAWRMPKCKVVSGRPESLSFRNEVGNRRK